MEFRLRIPAPVRHFKIGIEKHREGFRFIRKHQLWLGLGNYGWLSKVLLVIASIVGFKFLSIFVHWFKNADASSPLSAASNVGHLFQEFFTQGFQPMFMGGMKYFTLILVEVLVFHFSRRTLELLTKRPGQSEFRDFVNAQVRMIKVAMLSWLLELIFIQILAGIFFGIFGWLEFLKPIVTLSLQCFLLGFAVIDNYNEQFGLTIRKSLEYTVDYLGLALAVGAVLYGLFLVPVIGPIIGPIITAVAATLAMYEISDLHLVRKSKTSIPETETDSEAETENDLV